MKVLLSIKPEYVDKIFNGEKRYEYRKVIFRDVNVDTVVVYATQPVGRIVGEFRIDNVTSGEPGSIWEKTREYAGISRSAYFDYFEGKERAYAIRIRSPKRYATPIDPKVLFTNFSAPQSFIYLSEAVA
jgi:predicted transcriptional regulator